MFWREFALSLAGICLVASLVISLAVWGAKTRCARQWEHSGMKSEYRTFQGCVLTLPDGRKIPAENYREL